MSAPAKPDQAPPKPQGTPVPSGSPPTPTPPTNPPGGQSTEGGAAPVAGQSVTPAPPAAKPESGQPSREQQIIAAQEAVLREQAQQIRQLSEVTNRTAQAVERIQNPPPTAEEVNQRYWKDPVGVMREEMAKMIDPLRNALGETRATTELDRLKADVRKEYGDEAFSHMESSIDQLIGQAVRAGNPVTQELVGFTALAAYGNYARAKETGRLPAAAPAQPAAPTNGQPSAGAPVVTPPYLAPSAAPQPRADNGKQELRQLSENERRLARERGMTDEQFLNWLTVKPEDVVKSTIGKPEAK